MRDPDARSFETVTAISRWNSPSKNARAGGDWSEIFALSPDIYALTIGDVTGSGEPASATAEYLCSSIVSSLRRKCELSLILTMANALTFATDDGVLVTAIVGIIDTRRRTFRFVNAGHPSPIMLQASAHAFLPSTRGLLPLGVMRRQAVVENIVTFPEETLIVLYTDGVTENERDVEAGEENLARACRLVYESREPDAARIVAEHVFARERGFDDAAILAARIGAGRV